MTITEGGMEWPLASGVGDMPAGLDAALVLLAQQTAVEWLWALSGRQFGTYPAAYRPQTRLPGGYGYGYGYGYPSFLSSIYGPLPWTNYGGDGDPLGNSLGVKQVLPLPSPAVSVTSVVIYDPTTGAATTMLPADVPALFRLEGNYLIRQDGGQWPETQNMIAKLGDKNTWVVNYSRGLAVPTYGQVAGALLAAEFGKRFAGDPKCRIPYNAVTVSRGGVTINRNVVGGKATTTTGVPEVDQWVAMVNPNGLQSSPVVWSPDSARNARPFSGSYAPGT